MTIILRPLEVGKVYRVTTSFGCGPQRKRRCLHRFIGRLVEVDTDGNARFKINKQEFNTVAVKAIVELRYVEEPR